MAPSTIGKCTRKDTTGRRNNSPPSSPLLGPYPRLVLLLASWCILHNSPAAKEAPRIRCHHGVRAEHHHPTIPRSNNRYTHYHYSSSSSAAADGALETSDSGSGCGKSGTHHHSHTPSHFHPPWNPSPKIDPNGFLSDAYARCPGEWESRANIRGRHGPGGGGGRGGTLNGNNKDRRRVDSDNELLSVPVLVRQVPGDGNCLFHSISACLHHAVNGTHLPARTRREVAGVVARSRPCSRSRYSHSRWVCSQAASMTRSRNGASDRQLSWIARGRVTTTSEEWRRRRRRSSWVMN